MEENNTSVSKIMSVFLVAVAALIDILQWFIGLFAIGVITIPLVWIINGLINVVSWLLFYIWLTLLGVSFVHPKKILTMGASFVGDTIAGGFLPAWTICVLFLLYFEKIERLVAHIPGGETAVKAASLKLGKKPPVLPSGPAPTTPKGPPPIPPRPGEPGYGDIAQTQTYKLRQNVSNFQNRARTEAAQRAEGLRAHEEKYREDIERDIKKYGEGGQVG